MYCKVMDDLLTAGLVLLCAYLFLMAFTGLTNIKKMDKCMASVSSPTYEECHNIIYGE